VFHQFFGENMLRADVCNAVEELGQLLDHTGPVAASERNAARIFNSDHMFFVTNGTSTSNKMVWHANVAPGDIVVVDRNCHKSILHAIMMTGAIPVFLMPTRNHYGIIGPIPESEFSPEAIRAKIAANPLLAGVDPDKIKEIQALYGFDKPPVERYFMMLKRFAKFDLGQSYFQHRSVWELVKSKMPASISLGLWTFFLTYLISVPLGISKAIRAGSRFDVISSMIVLVGYAIPGFVLGVLLLVLFLAGSDFSYAGWAGLFAHQWFKLATFSVIVCLLYHAWVGVRDVWMDYVTHSVFLRLVFQVATILWLVACAGYAAQILWRV